MVSPEEFNNLINDQVELLMNTVPWKPRPPVSREKLTFWGWDIEYDHHAPEYLKAIEQYEKQQKKIAEQIKQVMELDEITMLSCFGPVTVKYK